MNFDPSLLSIHGLRVWIFSVLYQTLPNDAIKTGHYVTSRRGTFEGQRHEFVRLRKGCLKGIKKILHGKVIFFFLYLENNFINIKTETDYYNCERTLSKQSPLILK